MMVLTVFNLCSCSSKVENIYSTYDTSTMEQESDIERTKYYTITRNDNFYNYYIYDSNHNIVKREHKLSKKPNIAMTDSNLLKITVQAGTGKGTQWGYFYNINTNEFSDIYYCIYDQYKNKVAYGEVNKVIVTDIFVKDKCCELSSFKYGLAVSAQPILNAEFINNGTSIKISYLSDNDYEVVNEIFRIIL